MVGIQNGGGFTGCSLTVVMVKRRDERGEKRKTRKMGMIFSIEND